jgi:protein-disulfide isomerase
MLSLCAAAALGLAACTPRAPGAGASDEVAARVDGEAITLAEVDETIKDDLYELRRNALDNMIAERLVERAAKQAGRTPEEFMQGEVSRRSAVPDAEVQAYYDQHKDQMGERKFEDVAPQIRQGLEARRAQQAAREFVGSLREQAKVEVELERPRLEVAATGPARGPADAPVTIVEFSDYQCPFCRRVEPTVKQVLERYGDRVRFVYRHFPLDRIHPQARGAAEAAACADDQERFWEFHDRLFADGSQLDAKSLESYAGELGLDVPRFQKCVAEGRFRDLVERDAAEGRRAGVSGTPAFFINGVKLSGAQPLDQFVEVIDQELEGGAS